MESHTINLIYNPVDKSVIGQRDIRPIKIGDQLIFESAVGPVHVKIHPEYEDVFSLSEYQTGEAPLVVKKRAKFEYWCGVKVQGQPVGYPLNKQYGGKDDTGVP